MRVTDEGMPIALLQREILQQSTCVSINCNISGYILKLGFLTIIMFEGISPRKIVFCTQALDKQAKNNCEQL